MNRAGPEEQQAEDRARFTSARAGAAALLVAVAVAVAAAADLAHAGDPTLRYYTIESEHFVVHFDHKLTGVGAGSPWSPSAHRTLAPALDHAPREKTLMGGVAAGHPG